MCGEHDSPDVDLTYCSGSSPLVRGARALLDATSRAHGIIPACAGSTIAAPRARRLSRDHPRLCGEHVSRPPAAWSEAGSSPLVRGARTVTDVDTGRFGIIPACAGSTCRAPQPWRWSWDHPRLCGEHPVPQTPEHPAPGSSPLVRGARLTNSSPPPQCEDHPRLCGEHDMIILLNLFVLGSSPLVRGAPGP